MGQFSRRFGNFLVYFSIVGRRRPFRPRLAQRVGEFQAMHPIGKNNWDRRKLGCPILRSAPVKVGRGIIMSNGGQIVGLTFITDVNLE